MSGGDYYKIAKMLGDVQKTPEWEAVRKRNAWVIFTIQAKSLMSFYLNKLKK